MQTSRSRSLAPAAAAAVLLLLFSSAPAADLFVGPGQTYTTIQAAVDAAAATGDTIHVDPGTYVEQVIVDTKDLAIIGAGAGATIVEAPTGLASLFTDTDAHYPVIGVQDADVSLSGLTVDGLAMGNLHELFYGVLFHDAGGALDDVTVTGVLNSPFDGTEHGVGVGVIIDDATPRDIDLAGCLIENFQHTGLAAVTAAGTALTVTVDQSEIVGAGATAVIAQNGVQVTGGDAVATITGTTVRDLAYTGLDLTATGLLLQDATGTLSGNTLGGCQTAVHLAAAAMTVDQNDITVPRPTDFGRGVVIDNTDPAYAKGAPDVPRANPYLPDRRSGRTAKATLAMTVTGNTITLDPALDEATGTVGIRAENVEANDDLDLTATGNVFTGLGTAILLRDSTPTSGTWLAAACSDNTFDTCPAGLDSDLALEVVAEDCWWGALDGPGGDGPGSGVAMFGNVDYDPWRQDVLNLLCVPAALQVTEAATTDTVTFDYTGGASGRIYGFSIDVTWDPAVAAATASDFTRPDSGLFATADYFLTQDIDAGHVRIDLALGSFVPGAYAGPMFQAVFALEPAAADEAVTAITPTVVNIRDNLNQPLAGLVPDPGSLTVDSSPVVSGVTVTDTTLGSTDWTRDGHDISIVATVVESSLDSLRCDLTAFGGPVLELADAMVDGNTYTWTHAGISGTGDGDVVADVTAQDTQAAATTLGDAITADNTPPAALAGVSVTPGHETVHLAWTEPTPDGGSPLAGVEFRYVTWGNYPAYAGPLPDPPADLGQGQDPGLGLLGGSSADWTVAPRDVYVLAGFVVDFVGNASPLGESGAATNYWLGDHNGDGYVDVLDDLTALGDSYGKSQGDPAYDPVCDVGPTFDWSPRGVPHPEADGYQVQFEDLMVTALNHDEVDPEQKSRGETPDLRWQRTSDRSWVLVLVDPCTGLRGLNVRAALPDGAACTVAPGTLLEAQSAPVFLRNIDANGLDAGLAAMGPGAAIEGAGELLHVTTTRPLAGLDVRVSARDQANNELLDDPQSTAVTVPAAHRLHQNSPNPFNPRTTIRFGLPRAERVHLIVYSLDGRRVRTLVDDVRAAGQHAVTWEGRDDAGRAVATGAYFYTLQAGDFRQVRKMTLLK